MISSRAVLISSSLRQSRPACRPGSPFCSAPRSISPLGSPCLGSFLVLSFRPVHIVISSSRLALLPFLSSSRRGLPHSWRRIGGGDGRQRRWRRGFSLRAVFLSSLSFALSSGSHHRGDLDERDHFIISSVRLISLIPHCPGSSWNGGGIGPVIFQASNDGMAASRLIISSHYLIPSPSWSVSPGRLVSCVSSGVSHDTPGTSTSGRGGRNKQANTKKPGRVGDGTRNRGARRGEERNDDHKITRTEGRNKDGGQASRG